MTIAEEPEHVYGTRKRKNGLPHEHWVYAKIWRMTQQGENALTIAEHDNRELGMTADEVAYVMSKQRERGKPFPEAYGRPLGSGKFTMEHYDFICEWLVGTGARKTLNNMAAALEIRFGLEMSTSGLCVALTRHGNSHKRLTKQDKRAYTPANVELTRRFLLRRFGVAKEDGVWVDEMLFKGEEVGHNYGYAPAHLRAIQVDDGRGSGDAVMFISAMTDEEVLPISLPVVQPATVAGIVFELWCEHHLIPEMLARGKTFVVFDNARVHRKRVLFPLFWAAGIRVIFLPPYSPWFQPIEKIFLSTHMKCNRRVHNTRAAFIRSVLETLHGHTAHECAGCVRVTGWM
jgi:transposase